MIVINGNDLWIGDLINGNECEWINRVYWLHLNRGVFTWSADAITPSFVSFVPFVFGAGEGKEEDKSDK